MRMTLLSLKAMVIEIVFDLNVLLYLFNILALCSANNSGFTTFLEL